MAIIRQIINSSLILKLILCVGTIFLLSLSVWGYFNIRHMRTKAMNSIISGADRLSNTILLGTHYAMMINSRDDIKQIINNISRQNDIVNIRIYNKEGEIKFSNRDDEIDSKTNIKAEACYICHRTEPPVVNIALNDRMRKFRSQDGTRLLGVISPVFNEPGCSTDACHVHPEDKKVLGALDLVVSLEKTEKEIIHHEKNLLGLSIFIFLFTSTMIGIFLFRFIKYPIERLIKGTRLIEKGNYKTDLEIHQTDEMGQLARAITHMGKAIGEKQSELNKQKDQYQNLFELVPCIITVQDKNYRLLSYNREFNEKFDPSPGDYCYQAYKGRTEKCIVCPVEKTFEDGQSHYSEETGVDKDNVTKHWIVRTTPIFDDKGEIIAAMEMNLDITERKQLEEKLAQSEKKYQGIFNTIPNPVFVLAIDDFQILNCNESVHAVYGFSRMEVIGKSFLDFFKGDDKKARAQCLKQTAVINSVVHKNKNGKSIFVNIRISPSEYGGQKVLLATISDVTKRLEAEQQLIHAGKMATLGEMATGVAHELNQPLSVIKTASSFFMRKVKNKQPIKDDILFTMSEEIDSHVERATKIINHMRQFGRKSDPNLEKMQILDVVTRAFDIFSRQLMSRGIDVKWETAGNLPEVIGDPGRLEQVMINLLINARDAIEEKWASGPPPEETKRITISTDTRDAMVIVSICDTGNGIPDKMLRKIFEPFFTTKKVGKGTGLGLSISYGIIKECNGKIFARKSKTGGACFEIQFPIPKGQS